ncbi:MAG: transglutaminase-like domain-containing protein [Pirellulales bacterium]|nr:transglutaminase-like domain-containing protein [Pirellulales bacterium]
MSPHQIAPALWAGSPDWRRLNLIFLLFCTLNFGVPVVLAQIRELTLTDKIPPAVAATADSPPHADQWSAPALAALATAGNNQANLRLALDNVPPAQRRGLEFLLANMPQRDLESLSSEFLLTNVRLAYAARDTAPWGKDLSEELFFNYILPYANLDEKREDWRTEFRQLAFPLVKECRTPTEAAIRLNREFFPLLKVRYSTKRKAPNQSPSESRASGYATCTGLAIILVDVCRAVGVPARVVGTPRWSDNSGNHTWVEIWDQGWHFTGANEQDNRGLDHGWFTGRAAQAKSDPPRYAIYAASFARTERYFPLVWNRGDRTVFAEDVTRRYVPADPLAAPATMATVRVRVVNARGERVATTITVAQEGTDKPALRGQSRDETADINDHFTCELIPHNRYTAQAEMAAISFTTPAAGAEQTITVELPQTQPTPAIQPAVEKK